MSIKHSVEYIEHSCAKITMTIEQEQAVVNYNNLLNKYIKDAVLPGFRKGKIPKAMFEAKYTEALKAEAINDLMEQAMKEVFPLLERKQLGYSDPTLEGELDLDFTKPITFTLKIDVEPAFTTPQYKDISIDNYQITVTEDDITAELKRLQEQNAVIQDKNGTINKGDLVTVNYEELDEQGKPLAGKRREGFVFTVGEGHTLYDFDDDVIGLVKGDKKVINKKFTADHSNKEIAGRDVSFNIEVTAVKEKNLPDLDDELAQDINEKFKTLADLKADIKEKLQQNADASAKNKRLNDLIKQLAANTNIDLPDSMIKAESDRRFSQFARQSGFGEENLLKMLGGNKDDLSERWREESIESVKSRLILDRLLKEEDIKATDDEIAKRATEMSNEYGLSVEQMKTQLGNSFRQYIANDVEDQKLHEHLLKTVKQGQLKELTLAEFVKLANPE